MKKIFFIILFLFGMMPGFLEAASISEIERTQENLEKEKLFRERIEKGKKIFIEKIITKGITLISEEDIKAALLPFKNHWIYKDDIQMILDSIAAAYEEKGYIKDTLNLSYEVEEDCLIIKAEEKTL